MGEKRHIIKNSIVTPDNTELVSRHRHDYVTHVDKNGNTYAVDGGHEYIRRVCDVMDYEETSIYSDVSHEVIRDNLSWGTYGKNGGEPLRYLLLKDMTNDHINSILETQSHIEEYIADIFIAELAFRGEEPDETTS